MDENTDLLMFYAYRHSAEMGHAVEAVLNPSVKPTAKQVDKLCKVLNRDGGQRLSPAVYLALVDTLRRAWMRLLKGQGGSARGSFRDACEWFVTDAHGFPILHLSALPDWGARTSEPGREP